LAEFLFAVPGFRGSEGFADDFDLSTGDAAAVPRAEQVIEVEGFDDIVSADAVRGGELAEAGGVGSFIGGVSPMQVGASDKVVVNGDGEDAVGGWHGRFRCSVGERVGRGFFLDRITGLRD
jgi:hypothetical protein